MSDNIHEGHRQRLKQRFEEHGIASFSDVEALELLLFFAVPRRDTNKLAHELLKRFGCLRAVLEAEPEELRGVNGAGASVAMLIRLVAEMNRRYMISKRKTNKVLHTAAEAGEYLMPLFAYQTSEVAYVLSLDSRSMVTRCHELARGMVNKVDFTVRDIVDAALRDNAARIIIAHNHLSGTALPSNSDISATKKIQSALSLIGVELADHIIVCDDDFVSLRDSGLFNRF